MAKKKINHTVIRNEKLFCLNCGGEQVVPYPIQIPMMSAMIDGFNKIHGKCEKKWVQPVLDQSLGMTIRQKMSWWIKNGEHGISSKTLLSVLGGCSEWAFPKHNWHHPCDPSDFRRCSMLLDTIPEWRKELYKMKDVSVVWAKLVDNWDKLELMLKEQMSGKKNNMLEFMQSLGC